jgi:uncharacterized protein YbcI
VCEGDCFGVTRAWTRGGALPVCCASAFATGRRRMEVPEEPKESTGQRERLLLRRLSRSMGSMQKAAFGTGPLSTKSYMFDDMLLIVMREGLTQAEQTMLEFGRHDLVRAFRQQFENEMTRRIVDMIEELTERKVLTYQSQIMFDPHVVVEMFVFDNSLEAQFAAAEAGQDAEE